MRDKSENFTRIQISLETEPSRDSAMFKRYERLSGEQKIQYHERVFGFIKTFFNQISPRILVINSAGYYNGNVSPGIQICLDGKANLDKVHALGLAFGKALHQASVGINIFSDSLESNSLGLSFGRPVNKKELKRAGDILGEDSDNFVPLYVATPDGFSIYNFSELSKEENRKILEDARNIMVGLSNLGRFDIIDTKFQYQDPYLIPPDENDWAKNCQGESYDKDAEDRGLEKDYQVVLRNIVPGITRIQKEAGLFEFTPVLDNSDANKPGRTENHGITR